MISSRRSWLKVALVLVSLLTLPGAVGSLHADLQQFSWGVNVGSGGLNDVTLSSYPLPDYITSTLDSSTGLGSLTIKLTAPADAAYFIYAYFDYDFSPSDTGVAQGTKPAGVRWQIDSSGNIISGFFLSPPSYNNRNDVDGVLPGDAALGMGFDFSLGPGRTGVVTLNAGSVQPPSGFFLEQQSADGSQKIFLQGSFAAVPEPGWALLFGSQVLAIGFACRLWRRRKV